jgi:hypothetical protein
MSKYALRGRIDGKCLEFRTEAGFSLGRGNCSIRTDRGTSYPRGKGSVKIGVEHQIHSRRLSSGAIEFWQSIRNLSAKPIAVTEIVMFDGILGPEGAGWRVAHSELFKCDRCLGGFGFWTDGLFAPIAGLEGDFGISEDWPFPGIFFTHPERGTVLMTVLSQERCKPYWHLRSSGKNNFIKATEFFFRNSLHHG